ncbi:UDP-N-acetylglucosamine 1-carboxyvinyltransferase [Candidatus Dependentiae bacterium]|nr:MAG: UDP-N-acetylglucosamine 1-carboxyvinyltransferase [Candidatus Dependentiae bacterium]
MKQSFISVQKSYPLEGTVNVSGSKNASMVILLSALLAKGISRFYNIPAIADVFQIGNLLQYLGADFTFDVQNNYVEIDTNRVENRPIPDEIMKTTRASILVLGPLLARFGSSFLGLPGGDAIGARPIDLHLDNMAKMGVSVGYANNMVHASVNAITGAYIVLAYPSVGATENILMLATVAQGRTTIVNAAIEPEVLDLIALLQKMGASITVMQTATIVIDGVKQLQPVDTYTIISDRLEAGALLIAAAITGGDIYLPNIMHTMLDVPLLKLAQMGYTIEYSQYMPGIRIKGCTQARAISFKTGPYPNFPTDLQAPMMAALVCAQGISIIEETVFENRLQHAHQLSLLGANIEIIHTNKAKITGVKSIIGATITGNDIRAVCSLVLAGLVAEDTTKVYGVSHWLRGFEGLEKKLNTLGAPVKLEAATSQLTI